MKRMIVVIAGLLTMAAPFAFGQDKPEHWGVVSRNTIGSGIAQLRNGPAVIVQPGGQESDPPFGKGSLGIEVTGCPQQATAASQEKVDFGNEVDFYGNPLSGLTAVGYYVFQTGENASHRCSGDVGNSNPNNLPNIHIEVTGAAGTTYTTLVWVPDGTGLTVNQWSPYIDATTNGQWYFTGTAGTNSGCNSGTMCSFAHAVSFGGNILSIAVGKGRDYTWVGAVDGLRINKKSYDFEADGVHERDAK